MNVNPQSIARQLPDIPRWVYLRAALLAGDCMLYRDPRRADCFVLRRRHEPLGAVIGHPSAATIAQAMRDVPDGFELLAPIEQVEHVKSVLTDWQPLEATLYAETERTPSGSLQRGVRVLRRDELEVLSNVPPVIDVSTRYAAMIAVRLVDSRIVAACYTNAMTETLWDAAVDTLPEHRRQGHARACFHALAAHFRALGRRAVWGAADDNFASRHMAENLGLVATDRIAVFLARR